MGRASQGVTDPPNRYVVVPRTLCFVTHGQDVLLLKGAADKTIWPNLYNGIGGHVEPGEDVCSAARREIREETGLEVTDLALKGVINIYLNPDSTGVIVFVFTARALERETKPSREGIPLWVSRDRVPELDLVPDLPVLIPRVLELPHHAPPLCAHYSYDDDDQLVMVFPA